MIKPHHHGKFLSLKTASGETRGYIIAPGQESNARTFIWCAMLRGDLTPAEAALLVKGTVQIESRANRQSANVMDTNGLATIGFPFSSRLAAFRGLVSRAIDGIGAVRNGRIVEMKLSKPDRTWKQMECGECGSEKVRTEGGAVLCPKGCGRLLDMDAAKFKRLVRERRRERWLEQFPLAGKLKRGFMIEGKEGPFKRSKPEGAGGTVLRPLNPPIAGALAAKFFNKGKFRVYYFAPMKVRSKKSKAVA